MKPYEIIEHTADIGLKAHGSTLKELFENAAKGMFGIISGFERTGHQAAAPLIRKKIQIKNKDGNLEELLVRWLSELLYIFNKEEILFGDFKVFALADGGIEAEASGGKTALSGTPVQTEIKAVTFHGLKIERDKTGFKCNVIFDV